MEILDAIRYWLGVAIVATLLPALVYWILVHGFTPYWKKAGKGVTFTFVFSVMFALIGFLFIYRDIFMTGDLGASFWLWGPAVILVGFSFYIEKARSRHLDFKTLVGKPEIDPEVPSKLLTEGIYAKIRHPRYLSFILGTWGYALFINYTGVYLYLLGSIILFYLVIILEERELRSRFGAAYDEYARKTPGLFPGFKK